MYIAYMREFLRNLPKYKGARGWIEKVNKMPDRQVMAIYYSMIHRSAK